MGIFWLPFWRINELDDIHNQQGKHQDSHTLSVETDVFYLTLPKYYRQKMLSGFSNWLRKASFLRLFHHKCFLLQPDCIPQSQERQLKKCPMDKSVHLKTNRNELLVHYLISELQTNLLQFAYRKNKPAHSSHGVQELYGYYDFL